MVGVVGVASLMLHGNLLLDESHTLSLSLSLSEELAEQKVSKMSKCEK
jgi:hypothetical protein